MTIKDRGTKKWTSFWIPQHVQMLNHLHEEDTYERKPQLDEQELEEINTNLHVAIHHGTEVEITYFKNHHTHKIKAKLQSIDLIHQRISLDNVERTKLNTADIVHISLE